VTVLADIISIPALREQVELGNVRTQTHPEFPHLFIANYTEQAAFNREWNDVTRMCRGLIWNDETGEVLARPFPKFFNFDEKEAPRILDDQIVYSFANKYDGSLGILYTRPDGRYAIATRGSFDSEQARLGTKLFNQLPDEQAVGFIARAEMGYTPLFEVCGPDNRIVLKYDENFLAPLGYMHVESGMFLPHEPSTGNVTMRDLLMDLSRTNAEGWVVWKTAFEAVKIKQADYVELHRVVTNLSKKEVWRQLRAGTYNDFKLNLPDEWWDWAEGIADDLRARFALRMRLASIDLSGVRLYGGETRKEQALYMQRAVDAENRGLVFSLLDGKDISDAIWRQLEPRGDE
jgi:RNA ligase